MSDPDFITNALKVAVTRVLTQIDNLYTHPSVRQALQEGRLQIHGWVYHIEKGEVWACKSGRLSFWSVAGPSIESATPYHSFIKLF
jgi:carbonic anhydrase